MRFDKSVSGYLEVLVAENELFAAELALVSRKASSYAQIVNVSRRWAVGGGWVDIAAEMAAKPQGMRPTGQSQAFSAASATWVRSSAP